MTKHKGIFLICFDLDGVLVSTKELHYEALNKALSAVDPKYTISLQEHLSIYDGLPTKRKLELLNLSKGLPINLNKIIWDLKQQITENILVESIEKDEKLIEIFTSLYNIGYKLAIVTNSIRSTTAAILEKLGILPYVHLIVTNQDVTNPKPNCESYLRAMVAFSASPKETLIIEDSIHGITSATDSSAHVLIIRNPEELSLELVLCKIQTINCKQEHGFMLSKEKLNIVIPMAGAGSRFEKAGFTFPKPLIEVIDGKPMIQVVVESIGITANYIYLVNIQYYEKYNLKYLLNIITPNCKIICVDKLTEGAACTVLLAKEYINNDQELLIANSDQYIEWNPLEFFYLMQNQNVDGGVLTFRSQHPKWSYAKVDDNNIIQEIAEKCVISNISTVGIYYWKQGKEMVWAAEEMIRKNIRTNGEFYLAPSINESIQEGKKFKIFDVDKMFGLGTPEDLQNFKDQINTKKSYN